MVIQWFEFDFPMHFGDEAQVLLRSVTNSSNWENDGKDQLSESATAIATSNSQSCKPCLLPETSVILVHRLVVGSPPPTNIPDCEGHSLGRS
jgi:hypothetical protein